MFIPFVSTEPLCVGSGDFINMHIVVPKYNEFVSGQISTWETCRQTVLTPRHIVNLILWSRNLDCISLLSAYQMKSCVRFILFRCHRWQRKYGPDTSCEKIYGKAEGYSDSRLLRFRILTQEDLVGCSEFA